ncbi:MAG: succinate dehydrogenase cytochrome b subunit [Nocardioides sp.]
MATTQLVKNNRASRSTVFLKIQMAVSGLIFIGYVLLHMYGNLKAFAGQEAYDEYAHHLRTFGEPMLPYGGLLWIVRIVLILAILAHLRAVFTLWARAGRARSTSYSVKKNLGSTLSSRTMRWGGVALLLFIVWHLVHFTIVKPTLGGSYSSAEIKDSPFLMLLNSFDPSMWWVTVIYLLALAALGMHLHHGVWSAAQTLGLTGSAASRARAKLAAAFLAGVVAIGFALVPLGILFGVIKK